MLVGIIAYLGRAGHEKELSTVYNWAIAGVIASFISAYLFVEVLDNTTTTGSGREIIEGCTALLPCSFSSAHLHGWAASPTRRRGNPTLTSR